jgi:UDP-N-acetylglucosamine/UDP-N-acetylgalactosamine diphosphorylase
MITVSDEIRRRLRQFDQEHVLAWWDRLTDSERAGLLEQIQALDLEQLRRLYENRNQGFPLPAPDAIAPVPVVRSGAADAEARTQGEEALRRGEVAVLLVAGGQGSRLGFEQPKGMFPIGPVSNKCLFQIHVEKARALAKRYGRPVPFLVMTSPATDEETRAYFADHEYFGLPREEVWFFRQETMPALDLETGKLLLEGPGKLFASPNGHGGTITALDESGILERLRSRGIRLVFYFQVDNPLIKMADPVFLGHHLAAGAQVSSKVVAKEGPTDKLGNIVQVNGRCRIIEYSDLSEDVASRRDDQGQLRIWAGSPAIHVFSVDFLCQVTRGTTRLPFHFARKKVPFLNHQGVVVEPERENALKFEMFIFDVLPMADRWTVVETSRREEFVPLKNATGPDSPTSVRAAISNLAADWLERAGVRVPRDATGNAAVPLEISPLYALDAGELAAKIDRGLTIQGPTYLQ